MIVDMDFCVTVDGESEVFIEYPVTGDFHAQWLGQSFTSNVDRKDIEIELVAPCQITLSEPAYGILHIKYKTTLDEISRKDKINQLIQEITARGRMSTDESENILALVGLGTQH